MSENNTPNEVEERAALEWQMQQAVAGLVALVDRDRELMSVRGALVGQALHTISLAVREAWFQEATLPSINDVLARSGLRMERLN